MRRVLNCLWFLAILLTFSTLTLAQTMLIGSSTVQSGRDNNSPGAAEAFKATASSSGTVTSCNLYLDAANTAKTVVFGIYSYNHNHPRTLLSSGSISSPIAGSWSTIPISPVSLTANTTYYLALLGLGGTIQYRDTAGTSETSLQSALTSLPFTWSSGATWSTGNLSAYCSGNTGVTVSIAPTSVTVNQGTQQQFTATVTGTSNTAVVWSVKSGTGTISGSGLYTAPHQAETDVVQVQSQADPTKSATAMVTVPSNAVSVSISPTNVVVKQSGTQQFTAAVTNCGANCGVNWSESGNGAITATGLYTAPNQQENDSVRATSQADNTKSASTSVTVPAVSITISPMSADVQTGGTQQFTTTVSGTVNTQVTYSALNGTVDPSGLYTAPASSGSDTVTATAVAAPNPQASASVTIQNQNQNACGSTLNWTNSVCQQISSGSLNSAYVNGMPTSNAWTVVSRHGEYGQAETECNNPAQIGVGQDGGVSALKIIVKPQSTSCGDWKSLDGGTTWPKSADSNGPWPYLTGDIQWNTLTFQNGTVLIRGRMPTDPTRTWPAWWLQDSRCLTSNKYTGDTNYGGCPAIDTNNYREVDVVECYDSTGSNPGYWCQFHVANPNFGIGGNCDIGYAVDGNYHTWELDWDRSNIKILLDGVSKNGTGCNQTINGPLFFIDQIQTGGQSGTPNNVNLPASNAIDWIKVCDSTIAHASCAGTPGTDPHVVFYDDF